MIEIELVEITNKRLRKLDLTIKAQTLLFLTVVFCYNLVKQQINTFIGHSYTFQPVWNWLYSWETVKQ